MFGTLKKFKKYLVLEMLGTIHSGLMSKGFPTQTTKKSKMFQEEGEGGGNEVFLGLPCGRQKLATYPIEVAMLAFGI